MVRKMAKMAKDPNAPKRYKSGFFQFSAIARSQLVAEDPSLKLGEIGKKLGAAWKQLSDAEKAPYLAKAAEEKAVYDVLLADYKQTPSYAEYQTKKLAYNKEKKKKKAAANLKAMLQNQPKRGLSAYMLYSAANRQRVVATNPGCKNTDVMKLLGQEWKGADESTKKQFNDQAAANKKIYENAMEEYRLTEEYQAYLVAKKGAGKKKARRASKGPAPEVFDDNDY